MKKNKLSLEKFRISKLDNPSKILGGDVDDGGATKLGVKCVDKSAKWVKC
jgi:hypothetical protein|tara:strand:- start:51 stop:200 length:150 start_codon:yes stop_codon:yes gene_type:complete